MELLIDLAVACAALLAAAYCLLLSRRLRALTRLDSDVGRAIAVLSKQVDDLTHALVAAEKSNTSAGAALGQQITKAEATARQLELLLAAGQSGTHLPAARAKNTTEQRSDHISASSDEDSFTPIRAAPTRKGSEPRRRVLRQREYAGDGI
jgi:hypothetical protein